MMKYQVEYYDPKNGATSPIDVIEAPEGYTAEMYIEDCEGNADDDWCEMLKDGKISVLAVENDELG